MSQFLSKLGSALLLHWSNCTCNKHLKMLYWTPDLLNQEFPPRNIWVIQPDVCWSHKLHHGGQVGSQQDALHWREEDYLWNFISRSCAEKTGASLSPWGHHSPVTSAQEALNYITPSLPPLSPPGSFGTHRERSGLLLGHWSSPCKTLL